MNLRLSLAFFTIAPAFLIAGCSHHDHDHEHGHDEKEEEHEHHHEGAISFDSHRADSFGVEVAPVVPGEFSEVIRVSGQIEPSATDVATVTATRSGIFTLSSNISQGSRLNVGAPIGHISSKGLQGNDQSPIANAAVESAHRELKRLEPLYKDGLVSAAVYNDALRAYNEAVASKGVVSAGSSSVSAPIAGVLTDIYVSSGQFVEVGAPVARIVRNSRLTLRADVPQRYISSIPSFTSANFRPDCSESVFTMSELDGHAVAPGAVNPADNGYIPVYFSFQNNGRIAPGAFAEIYLIGQKRDNVISVPREALVEMQGNKYIYVRLHDHDDMYEKRLVRTGASDGIRVEILSGLNEGENVVLKGAPVIRMAETSAIAPPGHTHNH